MTGIFGGRLRTAGAAPSPTAGKVRDPYFDNARALLIVLVVVGHVIARSDSEAADGLYTWIYAFHMPAFILVSGFLARNFTATAGQCGKLLTSVVVPYVVFDLLYSLLDAAVSGNRPTFSPASPAFTLWFLFALVAWRLMVPLLRVLRMPVAITIALSLAASFGTGTGSNPLDRIFSFLPFFAIGVALTPERIARFRAFTDGLPARLAALGVLVGGLGVAYLLRDVVPRAALQMKGGFLEGHDSNVDGLLWRLAVIAAALLLTAALLAVTPRGKSVLTSLGQATLYVYLLHGLLLVHLLGRIGDWIAEWPQLAVACLAATALAFLLGSPPVRWATRWLIEPKAAWLLRPAPQPVTSPAAGPEAVGQRPGDVPFAEVQPEGPAGAALTEATMRLPVVPQPTEPATSSRPPAVPTQREPYGDLPVRDWERRPGQ